MTFSVRYPIPANKKDTPYSFSLIVAYVEGIPDLDFYGNELTNDTSKGNKDPDIVLDSSGAPMVVWSENSGDYYADTFVKHWNGSTWEQLGGALDTVLNNGAQYPDVAVDSQDCPVVVWQEWVDGQRLNIYVKRWDGANSQQLDSALDVTLTNTANEPAIKINSSDQPVVVFEEDGVIYSKTWDGSTWVQGTGSYSFGTGTSSMPAFVLDGDTPIVTWVENSRTYVKR